VRKLLTFFIFGVLTILPVTSAHNGGTSLTWNREISRVFFRRCADCHRNGCSAFSLMTYAEVPPRLTEIKHQVLNRLMPPWCAVKGFGDFRNDQALTQEEIELISDWIDADAPRGNNPNVLPPIPKFAERSKFEKQKGTLEVQGDLILVRPFVLDGVYPERVDHGTNARIVAHLPDSAVEPLVWFHQYNQRFQHPFLFRQPLELPAGTRISGIPPGSTLVLLPGKKPSARK
jgi:hypothetical protein